MWPMVLLFMCISECNICFIIFIAITCPNIYPTPFQTVICPSGTKYGSVCNLSCEAGTKLNGTDIVVCERKNGKQFGDWTWENNQPFCEGILKKNIYKGKGEYQVQIFIAKLKRQQILVS